VQEEMMCSIVSPSVPQILHLSIIDCNFNIIPEIDLQLTELVVAAFTAISVLI
jgi:hypothetical protein